MTSVKIIKHTAYSGRRGLLGVLLLLAALLSTLAQEAASKPLAKEAKVLLALEKARLEAIQNKDVTVFEEQLTADYSLTFEEGLVFDKAQVLEMVRNRPEGRHLEWTEKNSVRLYGETAIITGHYLHDFRFGKRKIYELRYTDTYLKHKGRWYLAATHFSQARER